MEQIEFPKTATRLAPSHLVYVGKLKGMPRIDRFSAGVGRFSP